MSREQSERAWTMVYHEASLGYNRFLYLGGDYAVLEANLGGGSGRYLAGHAGDHPVQRGHLVVGLVSHL